jgi:hypothetical protein
MVTTIETKFDPTALPKWAQEDEDVTSLCKIDLSFRASVHDAKTRQMINVLKSIARSRMIST